MGPGFPLAEFRADQFANIPSWNHYKTPKSNLDHEWEAVCASVIADGVLLIKDDGTYADGYLDHVVDGKESEPLKKKRSRREVRNKKS